MGTIQSDSNTASQIATNIGETASGIASVNGTGTTKDKDSKFTANTTASSVIDGEDAGARKIQEHLNSFITTLGSIAKDFEDADAQARAGVDSLTEAPDLTSNSKHKTSGYFEPKKNKGKSNEKGKK